MSFLILLNDKLLIGFSIGLIWTLLSAISLLIIYLLGFLFDGKSVFKLRTSLLLRKYLGVLVTFNISLLFSSSTVFILLSKRFTSGYTSSFTSGIVI